MVRANGREVRRVQDGGLQGGGKLEGHMGMPAAMQGWRRQGSDIPTIRREGDVIDWLLEVEVVEGDTTRQVHQDGVAVCASTKTGRGHVSWEITEATREREPRREEKDAPTSTAISVAPFGERANEAISLRVCTSGVMALLLRSSGG